MSTGRILELMISIESDSVIMLYILIIMAFIMGSEPIFLAAYRPGRTTRLRV